MSPKDYRRREADAADEPNADAGPAPVPDEVAAGGDLVLLVHATNMAEAELYRHELAAHGIPATVEGEAIGVAGIPDVGAGVPVLVPEPLADEAAELIAELESTRPEEDALQDDDLFDDETDALEEIPDEDLDDLDEDLDDLDEDEDEDEDLDDLDDDWDDEEDDDWDEDWDEDDEDEDAL